MMEIGLICMSIHWAILCLVESMSMPFYMGIVVWAVVAICGAIKEAR